MVYHKLRLKHSRDQTFFEIGFGILELIKTAWNKSHVMEQNNHEEHMTPSSWTRSIKGQNMNYVQVYIRVAWKEAAGGWRAGCMKHCFGRGQLRAETQQQKRRPKVLLWLSSSHYQSCPNVPPTPRFACMFSRASMHLGGNSKGREFMARRPYGSRRKRMKHRLILCFQ